MSLKNILTYNGTPVDDLSRDEAIAAVKWLAKELPGAPRRTPARPVGEPLRYCGKLVSDLSDQNVIEAAKEVDPSYRGCLITRAEAAEIIRNWRDGPCQMRRAFPRSCSALGL